MTEKTLDIIWRTVYKMEQDVLALKSTNQLRAQEILEQVNALKNALRSIVDIK